MNRNFLCGDRLTITPRGVVRGDLERTYVVQYYWTLVSLHSSKRSRNYKNVCKEPYVNKNISFQPYVSLLSRRVGGRRLNIYFTYFFLWNVPTFINIIVILLLLLYWKHKSHCLKIEIENNKNTGSLKRIIQSTNDYIWLLPTFNNSFFKDNPHHALNISINIYRNNLVLKLQCILHYIFLTNYIMHRNACNAVPVVQTDGIIYVSRVGLSKLLYSAR